MEMDVCDATRLLVVGLDSGEADRLVNIFRDAGHTTRAQHITSLKVLNQVFEGEAKWDLCIISTLPEGLDLSSLLASMEHQSKDIPIIIIADYKDADERMDYLRKGIMAVVPSGQDEMLLLKSIHEIKNLYIRRNYRRMSVALVESEKQRRRFLNDKTDAVVYLRDGIIRYANPAFYALFKKEKSFVFEGRPFISYVMKSEQTQVVDFLTTMEETSQPTGVFQYSMILENEKALPVTSVVVPTSYEGAFTLSVQVKAMTGIATGTVPASTALTETLTESGASTATENSTALSIDYRLVEESALELRPESESKAKPEIEAKSKSDLESSLEATPEVGVLEGTDDNDSALAKLVNISALLQQLEISIQQVVSGKGNATLVYLTIDNIQQIEQMEGSTKSQKLDYLAGEQIIECLDSEHTAASLGSGIFILLLRIGGETVVQSICKKILAAVALIPVSTENKELTLSMSIGAIVVGDTGKDASTLMVRAKHACSQSKKNGGGELSFFKPRKVAVIQSVEKHLAIMLQQSMKNKTLQLYYQPVVSLKGAESNYYEVLFSMTDPRGREHQASSFRVKLDNKTFWSRIDCWQFLEAGKQLFQKRKDGSDTRIFLHVGGAAMYDQKIVPWMLSLLKKIGLPPSAVVLEVSESNVSRNAKAAVTFFNSVKKIGCQTSIREFGCSVNPLELIAPMNVDFIKVDKSFTKSLTTDSGDENLKELKQILLQVAKTGKQIIVSEVPNTAALSPLWHCGVDFVQGPFLQNPSVTMDYSFDSDL